MPLPGKLDRIVQAFIGGAWVDITPYVLERAPVTVSRGRKSEGATTDPTTVSLTLKNRDLRWSPRNPNGPYFGQIGRNTPVAVGVRIGQKALLANGVTTGYVSAPDTAGLSVTGDIDVRMDVTLTRWRGTTTGLCGKYEAGQRSWNLALQLSGRLSFTWSTDGTTATLVESTVPVPVPQSDRCTVRATVDVNDGAGNKVFTFYYSTTPGTSGPWRQLGDPVISAGTTSLFNGTSLMTFGCSFTGSALIQPLRLWAGEVRNGIGGTVVASPDLRGQGFGAASFVDGQGNTWTVGGSGLVSDYWTLGAAEIPSWPLQRDQTGQDLTVPVVASGILRRLGTGASPVQSTMRKGIGAIGANLRAYWPLEEGARSRRALSAVAGGAPMTWGAPGPEFESSTVFDGSASLPRLNGATLRGTVRAYPSTGVVQVKCLLALEAAPPDGAVILSVSTGGTASRWDLVYGTGNTLQLSAYDSTGTLIASSSVFAWGTPLLAPGLLQLQLSQSGSDVAYTIATVEVGRDLGLTIGGTLTGRTVTVARQVQVNANKLLTDTVVGHVAVESVITSVFAQGPPAAGYVEERAGRRIERLCGEAGVPFVSSGDLDDTVQMGPQKVDTLLNLLRQCEAADGGILSEQRATIGLQYRPRSAIYSPGTRVILNGGGGTGGDLTAIEPEDDDQLTRNDVEVTRQDGSAARVTDVDGPVGTATVGTYSEAVTLNLASDEQTDDEAGWRLNLGTVDEPRYPLVEVRAARVAVVGTPAKHTAFVEADLGDGVDITSPPRGEQPTTIRQIVAGVTWTLEHADMVTRWVLQPARPWDVAVFDYEHPDEPSRCSSDGSTANGAHTAVTTTLSVATPSGPLWGFADGAYTIRIRETGEEMTVTGPPVGSTSPQAFPVARGVNGTTAKALVGGETVELARPVRWGA